MVGIWKLYIVEPSDIGKHQDRKETKGIEVYPNLLVSFSVTEYVCIRRSKQPERILYWKRMPRLSVLEQEADEEGNLWP